MAAPTATDHRTAEAGHWKAANACRMGARDAAHRGRDADPTGPLAGYALAGLAWTTADAAHKAAAIAHRAAARTTATASDALTAATLTRLADDAAAEAGRLYVAAGHAAGH